MTETDIRRDILAYLRGLPDCVVRVQQKHTKRAHQGTVPGWPDISGDYRGRALYIEVKKPGGAITKAQHDFILAAMNRGAIAFCAESVEEVKRWIR